MTFWLGVSIAYIVVAALGLTLGCYFAGRSGGRDGGTRTGPSEGPSSPPPRFAMDVPPLGSAFDRALLPGAFAEVSHPHAP